MRFRKQLYILFIALGALAAAVMWHWQSVNQEYSIVVVPLDSRPVNTQHLQLLGQIAGLKVLLPAEEIMDYFTEPADSQAVLKWLDKQAEDASSLIVHINTAVCGGLIASRHLSSYTGWQERLDHLGGILERYRNKEAYCILVLPRLLPTQFDNPGWQYRNQLSEYAQLVDKLAQGRGSKSERARLKELESELPHEVLSAYRELYQVNQELSEQLIALVEQGILDHLVLTLDDAAPYGLANLHQRALKQLAVERGVEQQVHVMQGADEVDMLTLARVVAAYHERNPRFGVLFETLAERELVLPFEAVPLQQLVGSKVEYAGGTIENGAAELLYIHSRNGWREDAGEAFQLGRSVGVVDVAFINRGDPVFANGLLNTVTAQQVASYAGWNTAGNSLGSVISHLVIKQAAWQSGGLSGEALDQAIQAEIEYRFLHFADAVCYLGETKTELANWVRQQGMDPYGLERDEVATVEAELMRLLEPRLQELKQHFLGEWSFNIGGKLRTVRVQDIQWQVDLPWPRIFEVRIIPRAILAGS